MMDKLFSTPCELTSDRNGQRDVVNFFPRNDGAVERVAARTNAVVISYVEEVDDEGERYLRHYIWVECKDWHLKDELLQKAKEVMEKLNG